MQKPTNKHPYMYDEDRGPYLNTWSGISFHLLTPSPEEVLLEDIAHHLAFQSRSVGAVTRDYSIAQHSLLVCDLIIKELVRQGGYTALEAAKIAIQALLHDAEEYVTGDVPKPLKVIIAPLLDPIAKEIKRIIGIKLGYDLINMPLEIKHADNIAMATERVQLYKPSEVVWHELPEPSNDIIPTMTSLEAEAAFLKKFHELASVV